MPWIEPHGNGYRVLWWTAGRGSPKDKSITFGSKKEAGDELRAVKARLSALRSGGRRSVLPLAELVEMFIASREGNTTEAHRDQSRAVLDRLRKQFDWKRTSDIRPDQCLSIRPFHGRVLRAFLGYATLANQVVDPRCLLVRPLCERTAKRARESVLLTPRVVADLIATATKWSPGDGALAHCIAVYGFRAQSLVGLTGAALNDDATLTLPVKSGDVPRAPLRPETVKLLEGIRRGPTEPLFVSHLGEPWTSGKEFAAWWGHCVGTQPGQGILDLRRFATTRQMAAGGQNAKAVADAQGRRTVSLVTEVYQRSTPEERRAVVTAPKPLPKPSRCPPGAPQRRHKSRRASSSTVRAGDS